MNANRRVLRFVVYSILLYFFLSVLAVIFHFPWKPFERINLVADLFGKNEIQEADSAAVLNPVAVKKTAHKNFNLYNSPGLITNFSTDTTRSSLNNFLKKLYELKSGKKIKVRIAYFGDSMIEGDLLTQTFRDLLQKYFGGSGVGFVPVTSQVSQFRQSVSTSYSGGWQDENFKTAGYNSRLFLSGHLFRSSGDWVQMTDRTIEDSLAIIEKSLIYGYTGNALSISVNNTSFSLKGDKLVNRAVLTSDKNYGIKLAVSDTRLPVYGVSFETASGVFVDNFSFRGVTGVEFAKVDSAFLSGVAEENPYDLIIIQYGVNLLFRPMDKNFNWYGKLFFPVLKKLKACFSNSDFIIVSTADRAFRYGGEYKSAIGIDSLIKLQASMAYESGSSFYNLYEAMGGKNSIVEWAARKPSLANRDYVHPNHRGAELLGNYFFEAIIRDYKKYTRTLKP